ncbi:MAG: penicillin-binding transpeptidase domain-containing protein [candidate division WOR-3 bacterium]
MVPNLSLALWMFQNAKLENGEYVYTMSDGSKVYFTVDPAIQRAANTLISTYPKDYEGLMLIDLRSGKILAISGFFKGEKSLYPFKINIYPAASIFKIVTLLSFLSYNDVQPYDTFSFCPPIYYKHPRRWLKCDREYPSTLYYGFGISNNALFGRLAVSLGFDVINEFAEKLYFNDTVDGIPFGRIKTPKNDYDLALLGSGFDGATLNPIQAARIIQIASTGYDIEPYIIDRIISKDGTLLYKSSPKILGRVLGDDVVGKFRKISISTVLEGTASRYFMDSNGNLIVGVKVGGKTGTLTSRELGGLTEWFVGFAPVENPEVGVVAFSVGQPSPIKPHYLAMRLLQAYFLGKFENVPIAYKSFIRSLNINPGGGE